MHTNIYSGAIENR